MILAQFNFPLEDNEGNCLHNVHRRMKTDLIAYFGGFTVQSGFGSWVDDDGKLYDEPVAIYSVAVKDWLAVRDLLQNVKPYAREANQKALYMVINGRPQVDEL